MIAQSKLFLAAAAAALAGPAMAGGVAPAVVAPAPVAAAPAALVADWSGFYAGLTYGKLSGSFDDDGVGTDLEDGNAPGLILGYNMQRGNFVFGGELAWSKAQDFGLQGDLDAGADGVGSIADLSGRVGYAAGRALFYGKVGYSTTSYDAVGDSIDYDGVSFGVGLDYLVTDNVFVGADYTRRNLGGDGVPDLDASTFGIRVGYKF